MILAVLESSDNFLMVLFYFLSNLYGRCLSDVLSRQWN